MWQKVHWKVCVSFSSTVSPSQNIFVLINISKLCSRYACLSLLQAQSALTWILLQLWSCWTSATGSMMTRHSSCWHVNFRTGVGKLVWVWLWQPITGLYLHIPAARSYLQTCGWVVYAHARIPIWRYSFEEIIIRTRHVCTLVKFKDIGYVLYMWSVAFKIWSCV